MRIEKILKSVEKPGRYTGGELGQIIKDKSKVKARWAFCFPDTYEIGMSNLGMRLLYGSLNEDRDTWCERVYAPWPDMGKKMLENDIELYALESHDPLKKFDIVAFTLQYELCYSNVLYMLNLAKIPFRAEDRGEDYPIIIGGGPCTYNAEPVADFFDLFSIGEGEEALPELSRLYISMKEDGSYTKKEFLHRAAQLEGFYIPSLYDVSYNEDGTVKEYTPIYDDIPKKVKKRIIKDMDKSYYPDNFVLPYIEIVHNRIVGEVYRGCPRGCRFCQAGMIYRPVRAKTADVVNEQCHKLYESSGYDEISLSSLSISDYYDINNLTEKMIEWTDKNKVSLSLPSLRLDSFTKELMDKISSVRNAGLTFAPEAGTQRLRDAINKNVCEEDLFRACNVAFDYGKTSVKLYFMLGLPTETYEDLEGIAKLAESVVELYYQNPNRPKGKAPSVTISVACFIPKPFTPFQWEAQDSYEELTKKQAYLGSVIKSRKVKYNWHDAKGSIIEAVFARGDRKLSTALEKSFELGACFDSWDEFFDYDRWCKAFEESGIKPEFYANRKFGLDEVLPWDIIDIGVRKEFMKHENEKAYKSLTTENCMMHCSGCGANKLGGERTWCPKSEE